jgi:hypothetical protein
VLGQHRFSVDQTQRSAYLTGLNWLAGAGAEPASQPAPSSSQPQLASIQPIQIQIIGTAVAHANN